MAAVNRAADDRDAPRRIQGHGTSEAEWLAWPAIAELPRRPLDDWIAAAQRLVVVAPHPDDEILAAGALAALHADRGGELLVVAVTDGEASHRGVPGWSPERLAAARRDESTSGLTRLLGATPAVLRLGFADSAVAATSDALGTALERVLRPTDVVVSTWRLDGHPDHEACGDAAARAVASVGGTLVEAPVWMWHWAAPGDRRVPWSRLRALAVPPGVKARRREAIFAHATQLGPRGHGEGPVLTQAILDRLGRDADCFFLPTP